MMIILFTLFFFSLIKVVKQQEKKAGTNFLLLPVSRNVIGWFTKTYWNKPIKLLQFITLGKIQKCLTSKYFSIFSSKQPTSWVAHITRDFLIFYSMVIFQWWFPDLTYTYILVNSIYTHIKHFHFFVLL